MIVLMQGESCLSAIQPNGWAGDVSVFVFDLTLGPIVVSLDLL